MSTLKINGREYAVETVELDAELAAKDHRVYGLTGKRGARYAAVQFINERDLFHVISTNGFTSVRAFDGVVLTDVGGELEEARVQHLRSCERCASAMSRGAMCSKGRNL